MRLIRYPSLNKRAIYNRRLQSLCPNGPDNIRSGTTSVHHDHLARKFSLMTQKGAPEGAAASKNITKRIEELGDWRGRTLASVRQLIHDADPGIQEEWKWGGTPVWSHDGIVCTGETYKQVVKLTFARGASLQDPKKLFNSSLEGNTRRAIDIREGEKPNEAAFKALIRSAVAANSAARARRASPKK
jgi:hypothetical protein